MKKAKFAIVGCGRISKHHIAGIAAAPSAELAAVCDIDENAAKKACESAGINRYYLNLSDMLEKEKPDVLCVCTPSGMHGAHAIEAMERGINVLCEKPLDIKSDMLDKMIEVQKKNHVILGGIFQRRNAAVMRILKEKYDSGAFGNIIFVSAKMDYYRDDEYYKSAAWRGTRELDGGCLMNQCIHGIDSLLYLVGDAASVYAKCERRERNIECEDTASALIKFKNGATGIVEATTCVNPGQDTVISVSGTCGSASVGDGGIYAWDFTDGSACPDVKDGGFGGKNCAWNGTELHEIQIEDMARAVLDGGTPQICGEDARRAADLILAMYKSSETGKEKVL